MKKLKASAEQIIRLLKAGVTPRFIRKKFPQTKPADITYRRRRLGMPPFPRGGPRGPRSMAARIKARRLRQAGWTFAKIGAALGVSRQRAHQYLSERKRPGRVHD
jgi:hypothetical protein